MGMPKKQDTKRSGISNPLCALARIAPNTELRASERAVPLSQLQFRARLRDSKGLAVCARGAVWEGKWAAQLPPGTGNESLALRQGFSIVSSLPSQLLSRFKPCSVKALTTPMGIIFYHPDSSTGICGYLISADEPSGGTGADRFPSAFKHVS